MCSGPVLVRQLQVEREDAADTCRHMVTPRAAWCIGIAITRPDQTPATPTGLKRLDRVLAGLNTMARAAALLLLGPVMQAMIVSLLVLLVGAPGAQGFYLPGVAPQDFKKVGYARVREANMISKRITSSG